MSRNNTLRRLDIMCVFEEDVKEKITGDVIDFCISESGFTRDITKEEIPKIKIELERFAKDAIIYDISEKLTNPNTLDKTQYILANFTELALLYDPFVLQERGGSRESINREYFIVDSDKDKANRVLNAAKEYLDSNFSFFETLNSIQEELDEQSLISFFNYVFEVIYRVRSKRQ
ncbi:hypothetical protein [Halobacteriovorax sp. CON-3]|uniref:hypothetical protein n=1 Tax=Halobacteriovorax sp. CON-3 TaxID=3157710 RepID=UPI003718D772